jgi:hypothetical protein
LGKEKCPIANNHSFFFEAMHFHYAMNFRGRNVVLEVVLRGHIKEYDEVQ